MEAKPGVVDVLNACLRFERTGFEMAHDQEHAFERLGYRKLECNFDKKVDVIRTKRHRLIKRLYRFDVIPDPQSDVYDVSFDVVEAFTNLLDLEKQAADVYADGVQTCFDAGDPTSAGLLAKNLKQTDKMIAQIESKLKQIETLGVETFLSMQD